MLKNEPSNNIWASPVVLVIDYRMLNRVTEKETLDTLVGSSIFSTLDLGPPQWDWQIELAEEDKEKTTLQLGFWQFWVMPFSVFNASSFERLMENDLKGL